MTQPIELIRKLYEFDDHEDSTKPHSISVTTLLGSKFRAAKYLEDAPRDRSLVHFKFKRSSMIGSAVHQRAELAFSDDPRAVQEIFLERELEIDGTVYTIAGKFDLLYRYGEDDIYTIHDWKTGYGKDRKQEALIKDAKQMSIYRWLLEGKYKVEDTGWSLAISQSNNWEDAIPVNLMTVDDTEDFIREMIWTIENNDRVDCSSGIKYNPCTYCDYICEERK